ncbi:MAG: hypothetical protein ABSG53_09490 [Thermoguttaceae bacterium]
MEIRKAIITAAGPNQDRLPLQRFVDLDGTEKTALQIILEEIIAAGIEEVGIVVRRGSQQVYREAAGDYSRMLVFVEQPSPRGYGEALYRAAPLVGQFPPCSLPARACSAIMGSLAGRPLPAAVAFIASSGCWKSQRPPARSSSWSCRGCGRAITSASSACTCYRPR